MDWNDLRILAAVAQTGGASAAAELLDLSHATVSRRIAALEKTLQAHLVDRSGQGWVVTPLGHQLAGLGDGMSQAIDEVRRIAHGHSQDMAGTVRISAPAVTIAPLLVPALQEFRANNPEIRLVFLAEDHLADLPGRKADIALRFTEKPDENLIGEVISDTRWGVYAAPEIAAEYDRQRKEAVGGLPIVPVIANDSEQGLPDWAAGRLHADCPCDYAFGFLEKLEMAARGFGLALTPRFLGDRRGGLVLLRDLPWKTPTKLWVLANADTQTSVRIRLVKSTLIRELGKVAGQINPADDQGG